MRKSGEVWRWLLVAGAVDAVLLAALVTVLYLADSKPGDAIGVMFGVVIGLIGAAVATAVEDW